MARNAARLTDASSSNTSARVASLLQRLEFDEELVAVGLPHDSVERGTLSEAELRGEMGDSIASLVMVLSEDPAIESFEARKAALREQVATPECER